MNDVYVCDFDEVKRLYNELKKDIETLDTDINQKKNQTINTLSNNWIGKASTAFTNSLDAQHSKINKNIESARNVMEFIKNASDQIQQLESELTSYEI